MFLDTQVYRKLGHNPEAPPLVALKELLSSGRLKLHFTDVVAGEVERQLHDYVGETATALNAAKRPLGRWVHRHPALAKPLPEFDQTAIAQAAFAAFLRFIRSTGAIEHKADHISPSMVFGRYFKREAPFQNPGSKEFPDAFNLVMLEWWCETEGEKLYFVGADKAVREAVDRSPVLLGMDSLEDLLASVSAMDEPKLVDRAARILANGSIQAGLKVAIESEIEGLEPVYVGDLAEGEVVSHELTGDIVIGDFKVLAVAKGDLRVVVPIKVPLRIELSYEDRSDALYDSEDGIYFGAEIATKSISAEPVVRFFVRITGGETFGELTLKAEPINSEVRIDDEHDIFK